MAKMHSGRLEHCDQACRGAQLKAFPGSEIAIIASGRMTNEELWLTSRSPSARRHADRYRAAHADQATTFLLSEDRNPNTNGAKLLGVTAEPGARLPEIVEGVKSGRVKSACRARRRSDASSVSRRASLQRCRFYRDGHFVEHATTQDATVVLPSVALCRETRLDDQRERPAATAESRGRCAGAGTR